MFSQKKPCSFWSQPPVFFYKKTHSKKTPYIFSKKAFLIFTKTEPCNFQPKPQKYKNSPGKICYSSRNKEPLKISDISGRNLHFVKKKFYFQFSSSEFSLSESSEEISLSTVVNFLIDFLFSLISYLHSSKNTLFFIFFINRIK